MLIKKQSNAGNIKDSFPIVGIGASAGGLDAFKKFIKAIPNTSGMAYVLVQHLDPKHESLLPELLQKVTSLPVVEISDDLKILPDHIYIIPSNKMLIATDGVLHLDPRRKNIPAGLHLPIDVFFTSLAEVHQGNAIGVVLSGTASDGTHGLRSIKDHGGITFAQDDSAIYDGMPHSAREAGVVDFILPPEKIPAKLLEISTQITESATVLENPTTTDDGELTKILSLLRTKKGTDFTYYKQPTIQRRIIRRMALGGRQKLADYLAYLRDDEAELNNLYQDLLIPVTSFFRDSQAFEVLSELAFPQLIENKDETDAIRVWVAGCSTGQEAYTIAIRLKEFLGKSQRSIQIFATDISSIAIEKARKGVYAKNEMAGLSPERLENFFSKVNGHYQAKKEIREICVFATHSFLRDPPFGKMDLISCRNVLIYMEPYLQQKALNTFHYSLNDGGYLLLGKSETAGSTSALFKIVSKNDKLYRKKEGSGKIIQVPPSVKLKSVSASATNLNNKNPQSDFQKTADDIMLNRYTPAGVVVNETWDIVHFRGSTGNYLEPPAGKPNHNVLKMSKSGLAFELRNLLYKAKKEQEPVMKENISFTDNDSTRLLSIEVIPLPNLAEPHYLILFHENKIENAGETRKTKKVTASQSLKDKKDQRILGLERELSRMREEMGNIIDTQQSNNEELQNTNDELLSSSEELQSLSEELETSKEELQTTSEELLVVNQELMGLNVHLTRAKEYAEAIIYTVRTPLLVLDSFLRIITANRSFYTTFHVHQNETEGKLIYDLGNGQWDIPVLRQILEEVLPQKIKLIDFEVRHNFPVIGKRVMILNGCEIVGESAREKLILLAIEDITEEKLLLNKEAEFKQQLQEQIAQRTSELKEANIGLKQKNEEIAVSNSVLGERNDDLLKLNKELESFTYVSSHDLQEPLRKIQMFSKLILDKEEASLSEKGREYFARIQDAAARMQTLIEDLLNYSRTNVTDRKFEYTDLNEIVEDSKTEFAEIILEKKAVIETDKLCKIRINASQFRQVINNLIANALKFSRTDIPPRIVFSSRVESGALLKKEYQFPGAERLLPGVQYCHISVADNGIGFESKYREQIFEVFQRLYTKDEFPGTGIGLAIVRKIINSHGGAITANGELNEGATFDIFIPET